MTATKKRVQCRTYLFDLRLSLCVCEPIECNPEFGNDLRGLQRVVTPRALIASSQLTLNPSTLRSDMMVVRERKEWVSVYYLRREAETRVGFM